jgi:hypothetical protein
MLRPRIFKAINHADVMEDEKYPNITSSIYGKIIQIKDYVVEG